MTEQGTKKGTRKDNTRGSTKTPRGNSLYPTRLVCSGIPIHTDIYIYACELEIHLHAYIYIHMYRLKVTTAMKGFIQPCEVGLDAVAEEYGTWEDKYQADTCIHSRQTQEHTLVSTGNHTIACLYSALYSTSP